MIASMWTTNCADESRCQADAQQHALYSKLGSHLEVIWTDALAGVSAYSGALCTTDLYQDGQRLVIADEDRKLKVWNNAVIESQHALLDAPVSVLPFHVPSHPAARLAVAAGCAVYIFLGITPHFRITLPSEVPNEEEESIWAEARVRVTERDAPAVATALAGLGALQQAGSRLSHRSTELLKRGAGGDEDAHSAAAVYLSAAARRPPSEPSAATCMTAVAADLSGAMSRGARLFVGTEAGLVVGLDPGATTVREGWAVGGVPTSMVATGNAESGYTLFIALRSPSIRVLRGGVLAPRRIALPAVPVALAVADGALYCAVSERMLPVFDAAALTLRATVVLPAPPLALVALPPAPPLRDGGSGRELAAVALRDCSVLLIDGVQPISRHTTSAPVLGLHGGRLAADEVALVHTLEGGALDVRRLQGRRHAAAPAGCAGGPEDAPLDVPRKTRLYAEFAQRERDNASVLYHTFQQDLTRLRLRTAEEYVRGLTGRELGAAARAGPREPGAGPGGGTATLTVQATLAGLGPRFRIEVKVTNCGDAPARGVRLVLGADPTLHRLSDTCIALPALSPRLAYPYAVAVDCVSPESGRAGDVHLTLLDTSRDAIARLASATIAVPVSELPSGG